MMVVASRLRSLVIPISIGRSLSHAAHPWMASSRTETLANLRCPRPHRTSIALATTLKSRSRDISASAAPCCWRPRDQLSNLRLAGMLSGAISMAVARSAIDNRLSPIRNDASARRRKTWASGRPTRHRRSANSKARASFPSPSACTAKSSRFCGSSNTSGAVIVEPTSCGYQQERVAIEETPSDRSRERTAVRSGSRLGWVSFAAKDANAAWRLAFRTLDHKGLIGFLDWPQVQANAD